MVQLWLKSDIYDDLICNLRCKGNDNKCNYTANFDNLFKYITNKNLMYPIYMLAITIHNQFNYLLNLHYYEYRINAIIDQYFVNIDDWLNYLNYCILHEAWLNIFLLIAKKLSVTFCRLMHSCTAPNSEKQINTPICSKNNSWIRKRECINR